jgi:hypothetical protein
VNIKINYFKHIIKCFLGLLQLLGKQLGNCIVFSNNEQLVTKLSLGRAAKTSNYFLSCDELCAHTLGWNVNYMHPKIKAQLMVLMQFPLKSQTPQPFLVAS